MAELAAVGLDPASDWLPIAPAAHYSCGGVVADLDGASSLPGLWVAGEASCNGVMGANRLASNSLLDGMVFGPRVVEAIDRGAEGPSATGAMRTVLGGGDIPGIPVTLPAAAEQPVSGRDALQRTMTVTVLIAGAEVTRGIDYQSVGTRVILAVLPPLVLALLAQRYIVRGLSLGAVKG